MGGGERRAPRPAAPRCASSINSTDKQEKRMTTRYVVPANYTARRDTAPRAKCNVARPLRVPRSNKLPTRVSSSLFLFAHFSLSRCHTSRWPRSFIFFCEPTPRVLRHRFVIAKLSEERSQKLDIYYVNESKQCPHD